MMSYIEGERKDVTESHIDEQLGMTSVQFQYYSHVFLVVCDCAYFY